MDDPRFKKERPCSKACRTDIVSTVPLEKNLQTIQYAKSINGHMMYGMQDTAIYDKFVSLPGWRVAIYSVFDGHGSYLPSLWCEEHIPHLVAGYLAELHEQGESNEEDKTMPAFVRGMPSVLDKVFKDADAELTIKNVDQSGTTATVALIAERDDGRRWLVVANVGDSAALLVWPNKDDVKIMEHLDFEAPVNESKIFLTSSPSYEKSVKPTFSLPSGPFKLAKKDVDKLPKGFSVYLKADHRGSNESEARRVRKCGGRISDNRVNGSLAMTRALGDHQYGQCVSARPDVYVCAIPNKPKNAAKKCAVLMLATDGCFDFVSSYSAAQKLLKLDSNANSYYAASKLVDDAQKAGSLDDIFVVVVRIDFD